MNIYIYKLTSRACPSLWTCWAVKSTDVDTASQWHNWANAPHHDHAELLKVVNVDA